MDIPEATPQQTLRPANESAPDRSALARMAYLCPSRYFHCYLFVDKATRRTCWLPEGYTQ